MKSGQGKSNCCMVQTICNLRICGCIHAQCCIYIAGFWKKKYHCTLLQNTSYANNNNNNNNNKEGKTRDKSHGENLGKEAPKQHEAKLLSHKIVEISQHSDSSTWTKMTIQGSTWARNHVAFLIFLILSITLSATVQGIGARTIAHLLPAVTARQGTFQPTCPLAPRTVNWNCQRKLGLYRSEWNNLVENSAETDTLDL